MMLLAALVPGEVVAALPESQPQRSALFPELSRAPLDPPLTVTGGFGEYRIGHFHAGLDLGTGGRVGRPVYAPAGGWIERVRASGVGYGRSIYLHTADGRLLVFGHLDAYAEPLASYVAAIQDSTGQYEQDLWPEPRRFAIRAGQRIAWSGESGAGGPHLHFEIRRGDMAYNPRRAGLPVAETRAPTLPSLTLEPLDPASRVSGGLTPRTLALRAAPETIAVVGRVRVVANAREGAWRGVDRMVPWSVRAEWDDQFVEARFDSISWATDMAEGDYVYDAGRVVGEKGLVLWAPRGFRPRVVLGSAPPADEAGTITVNPGDRPRSLRVTARDLGGHSIERQVILIAAPAPRPAAWSAGQARDFAARGAPALDSTAIAPPLHAVDLRDGAEGGLGNLSWRVPEHTLFEPIRCFGETLRVVDHAPELSLVGEAYRLHPDAWPLRAAPTFRLRLPNGESPEHVGMFQDHGDGWSFVRAGWDSVTRCFAGDSRGLGPIALFRDRLAPRLGVQRTLKQAKRGPYSRWALETRLEDEGSGVDARATFFVVDGHRVASEWDAEEHTLRWRPLAPPSKGAHRVEVIASDRAGNGARRDGTFVVD